MSDDGWDENATPVTSTTPENTGGYQGNRREKETKVDENEADDEGDNGDERDDSRGRRGGLNGTNIDTKEGEGSEEPPKRNLYFPDAFLEGDDLIKEKNDLYTGIGTNFQTNDTISVMGGCHILASTTGRLMQFLDEEKIDLSALKFSLLLDEADRMLDMGFMPDVLKIAPNIPPKDWWKADVNDRQGFVRLAEMNVIAMQLISLGQTEAAVKIKTQLEDLNTKWNSLQQVTQEKAEKLGSAHHVHSKHQKHQAFEAELAAIADRIHAVLAMGHNLIEKRQCAGSEEAVEARLDSIAHQWEILTMKTSEKSLKLKEAKKPRTYIAAVKDLDFWLGEVECLVTSEDAGKDLASVQNLMKKQQLVEADINAHDERIRDMNLQADSFIESEQFDAAAIQEKMQSISSRFERVKYLGAQRQSRLNEAFTLHQFFSDIADQQSWIREKKPIVGLGDYGRDFTGVQNLKKKHKRLEAELASHEPAIQAVRDARQKLMAVANIGFQEIDQRLKALNQAWIELKQLSASRGEKLDQGPVPSKLLFTFNFLLCICHFLKSSKSKAFHESLCEKANL